MIAFGEFEKNGEEVVVDYFTVLTRLLPGGTDEHHEKPLSE
jgi:hypothetical protein